MAWVTWLSTTAVSAWVRDQSPWLWPLCESLHFMGLVLVVGIAGTFDLRLLGFLPRIPLASLKALMPYAVLGVAINLATGIVFFVGSPYQYAINWVWWAKLAFIVFSGANAVAFEWWFGRETLTIGAGEDTPLRLKAIGAFSLVSWFSILFLGRMLAFIGGTD